MRIKSITALIAVSALTACGGGGGSSGSGEPKGANAAPVASNVMILRDNTALTGSDMLSPGDIVSFSYEYQDAEDDAQGSSVIEWQRTEADGGVTVITGATSNSYTVTSDDLAMSLSASVMPIATTGTLEGIAVYSLGVNVSDNSVTENTAPVATNVKILRNGTALSNGDALILGDVISVSYDYQDAEDDAQGSSVLKWQRTYAEDNVIDIAGATSSSYTIAVDDLANGISASVKPVATAGTLEGAVVASSVINVANNTVPVAQNIEITTGDEGIKVGSVLSGNYNFVDAEGDTEGDSTYRWLAVASDATETELGTEKTLTLPHSALNKTIAFEVTPFATTGLTNGVANRSNNEAVVSEYAFFTAKEPVLIDLINSTFENQPHLYISNGTVEDTTQLLNLDGALITQPLAVGSKWVFLRDRNTRSDDLMVTDGTPEGTKVITSSIYPINLKAANGLVYFSAYDETNGQELWSTDGTDENTQLVANINPGGNSSSPYGFTMLGDTLYFSARGLDSGNNTTGNELYSVNSDNVVSLVRDINPGSIGSNPSELTVFKGSLYFSAWDGDDDGTAGGNELWVSDGTSEGTKMLKDLTADNHSYPTNFTVVGDDLYFTTSTNSANVGELWRTRGTAESTTEAGNNHEAVSHLTAFNNKLIYRAAVSGQAGILWSVEASNDTRSRSTSLDSAKNPDNVIVFGDQLVFKSTGRDGRDGELYSMDNEQIVNSYVPKLIQDINSTGSSNPNDLLELNGIIIFSADDGTTGRELWSSDGQSATLLKDFITGSVGSDPQLDLPNHISISD